MEYDKSRIGIAYVNRAKERKLNKKKYKSLERGMSCCSFQYIQYLLQMQYKKRQKYIHTEILFCYSKNAASADSFGVFEDNGVTRQQRKFEREFDAIYSFCLSQNGKPFDYTAASWRLLIYPPKANGRTWWCASFVHAALRKIGLLLNYRLNTLDNDDLVTLIKKSNEFSVRIYNALNPGDFKNIDV